VGYRTQPYETVSLSVAAFYNVYDGLRSVERPTPPATGPLVLANGQEGKSYGAEVTADYWLTNRWRVRAGYTGLHVRIRAKPGSTDVSMGSSESHDPDHQLFLRSSVDLPANLELHGGLRYVTRIVNQSVPAYAELDARLAWHPAPRLELSLVGQNLLHDHHPEFGAGMARREIERGAYGSVLWHF
jgi:iron complex outermembrane receptor protein